MSSNVVTEPFPLGAGVYIDTNNAGSIYFVNYTILAGSQYGYLYRHPSDSTTNLHHVEHDHSDGHCGEQHLRIYLNGLTSGATIQNNGIFTGIPAHRK